jgi:ankyrin repeat protein
MANIFQQKMKNLQHRKFIACHRGHKDLVETLLREGAEVNLAKPLYLGKYKSWTPLHMACLMGHTEIVAMLIDAGALLEKAMHFGNTPLHIASGEGHAFPLHTFERRCSAHVQMCTHFFLSITL